MYKILFLSFLFYFGFCNHVYLQCNISQINFYLDYQVNSCNGMNFQSSVGGIMMPYDECAGHEFSSEFSNVSETVGTKKNIVGRSVKIFPNPAIYNLYITCNDWDQVIQLEIISSLGITCSKEFLNSSKTELNISSLASGHYFLRILLDDGREELYSFIKMDL